MAKVINPLMSQDARGCVSGIHFSKNPYGNYSNPKCSPTRSQQPNAIAYRSLLGNAHHAFDALTDAQKATWDLTPSDRPKPREHFLAFYLRRAARAWPQFTEMPPDHGPPDLHFFVVQRYAPPDPRFNVTWFNAGELHGYIDFVARPSSIRSYDGHPRKFRWQSHAEWYYEGRIFDVEPYAHWCTLQVSVLDKDSLKLYHRWVYHFDGDLMVSVDPPPP